MTENELTPQHIQQAYERLGVSARLPDLEIASLVRSTNADRRNPHFGEPEVLIFKPAELLATLQNRSITLLFR